MPKTDLSMDIEESNYTHDKLFSAGRRLNMVATKYTIYGEHNGKINPNEESITA
jgi:hypothetical protein